jgi:organic hydroperoxide reductase OsmC/OhrA
MRTHDYKTNVAWTGNLGLGTINYRKYKRDFVISGDKKPTLQGSSDPVFRGDEMKYNPEELLISSLSSCHMLWYLHLCADEGITVVAYEDEATGVMEEKENGAGRFTEVNLNPQVTITDASQAERASALHAEANKYCFIANSVNFPVNHNPIIKTVKAPLETSVK